MKRKGFTLVELMIVIAIIALLMGILMPALAKVRQMAQRLVCGTNLRAISTAMITYAADNDDKFPRAGGANSTWGSNPLISWSTKFEEDAFGFTLDQWDMIIVAGEATVSASLYLLIRYADIMPKLFICQADDETIPFKLSDYGITDPNFEFSDGWDFGFMPVEHCSYSYNMPYSFLDPSIPNNDTVYTDYAAGEFSPPGAAVVADRSPYIAFGGENGVLIENTATGFQYLGTVDLEDQQRNGNARAHQKLGQNVLFIDGHVTFEKLSYVAIDQDNIYTYWGSDAGDTPDSQERMEGIAPVYMESAPMGWKDSLLVNDGGAIY